MNRKELIVASIIGICSFLGGWIWGTASSNDDWKQQLVHAKLADFEVFTPEHGGYDSRIKFHLKSPEDIYWELHATEQAEKKEREDDTVRWQKYWQARCNKPEPVPTPANQ